MKFYFILYLFFYALNINAQGTMNIHFIPKIFNENLELNKAYHFEDQELTISNFKFYITDISFYKNDSLVAVVPKKAYLIDVLDSTSLTISTAKTRDFNIIKFNIGVDSLTSVSGVFDGDLDPMNGMYWTWQSGYINFKLEGSSTKCPARLNKFYWHIGGYMSPFNAQREITLATTSNENIAINIQLDTLFRSIDLSTTYQVMSPGKPAIQIADEIPAIFKTPK